MKKTRTRTPAAFALVCCLLPAGCAPLLLGGGAAGGYKTATDERTIGSMVDDGVITSRVKTALTRDAEVKARQIDVDTLQGVVTLSGVVESEEVSQQATAIAGATEGVREVRNNLQVGTKSLGQSMDDKLIGSKIKARLVGEPGIRSLNIDVDVHNGVVTLTGIVDNAASKAKALEIAGAASGARRVVDNLRVAR
jgi:hyperosmotically inducible periplasmic protein